MCLWITILGTKNELSKHSFEPNVDGGLCCLVFNLVTVAVLYQATQKVGIVKKSFYV